MTRQAIVNLLYFSRQTYYVDIEQTIILIILPTYQTIAISQMMTPLTPFSESFSRDRWDFYSVILHQAKVIEKFNIYSIEENQS